MNWLDFSKYENNNSKFTAELSNKGGYITFSNSGKGGNKKFFTLSLESFLVCLKDILNNHSAFLGHEIYVEKEWRDLGSEFFTDEAANAQCTVQTKPMFATLSKIVMWANAPKHDSVNPEDTIVLEKDDIQNAIVKLEALSDAFSPKSQPQKSSPIQESVIFQDKSIREFAKYVFTYFYGNVWHEVISATKQSDSVINGVNFISHDFEIFKRLIGEFPLAQTRETLTSSNTIRYFDEPVLIDNNKYYYFTTQWNGEGDYSLSFSNLKNYFEHKFPDYLLKRKGDVYFLMKFDHVPRTSFDIDSFINHLETSGLIYSNKVISRFTASLLTKPFVILTGLSGSGKTKLAQAFAMWLCEEENQYKLVPVGADWTNREPLLGFPNGLDKGEYVKPDTGVLDLLIRASENINKPYFLILDEMNLSHVERYFADFLSAMESDGKMPLYDGKQRTSSDEKEIPKEISIPDNLFVIGTVNIDETTYMFSPKVLDRANVIEFRVSKTEMENYLSINETLKIDNLKGAGSSQAESFLALSRDKNLKADEDTLNQINTELLFFFGELQEVGAEFGYRSAGEILRFAALVKKLDPEWNADKIIDAALMQKLLPKVHGSKKLGPVLKKLAVLCVNGETNIDELITKELTEEELNQVKYPLSFDKIRRMYSNLLSNGFTSYAEA